MPFNPCIGLVKHILNYAAPCDHQKQCSVGDNSLLKHYLLKSFRSISVNHQVLFVEYLQYLKRRNDASIEWLLGTY